VPKPPPGGVTALYQPKPLSRDNQPTAAAEWGGVVDGECQNGMRRVGRASKASAKAPSAARTL